MDPTSYRYKPRRRGQAELEKRIKDICETRVRYGYRRVQVLLRREGIVVNHKRTYRVYRELGLQLRAKTPKRRVRAKLREDRCPASRPNQTWAMDFVHDQLALGKKIRVLTVVDIFSKFSPVIDPRFSYRGEDVVATLEQVCAQAGYPGTIRVDQGSEFISRDLDLWAYAHESHPPAAAQRRNSPSRLWSSKEGRHGADRETFRIKIRLHLCPGERHGHSRARTGTWRKGATAVAIRSLRR